VHPRCPEQLVLTFCWSRLQVGPRDAEGSQRLIGDYFAIIAIFLYAAIYCFGYNSVPLTLVSEIFTMRFKLVSMTICLVSPSPTLVSERPLYLH
jgi:hypothetical protein